MTVLKQKHEVNFFGPSETSDGIGRAASLNLYCFEQAGFKVNKYVLSRPVALEKKQSLVITDALINSLECKINYFHFSARWVPHYFAQLSSDALKGFYNIGYWVCEVPNIPEQWSKQFSYFNEIWTASSFCHQAISRTSYLPVVLMPHPIEQKSVTKRIQDRLDQKNFDDFTFLTIANIYSDAERKNTLMTIRAFLNAFEHVHTVKLIVKVSNLEKDKSLSDILEKISQQYHNVIIITGYFDDQYIDTLYEQADVYISLHRAEGFGFTISDAMSRGIPVIVTGYSGNMDFCTHENALLVDYDIRQIGHERLRYKSNDVWAEPKITSATDAIKGMYENYQKRLRIAAASRLKMLEEFSFDYVSRLMKQRVDLISRQFHFLNDLDDRKLDCDVGIYEKYGF